MQIGEYVCQESDIPPVYKSNNFINYAMSQQLAMFSLPQNETIMISNKVKRNFFATLLAVGILCIIGRTWDVIISHESGQA